MYKTNTFALSNPEQANDVKRGAGLPFTAPLDGVPSTQVVPQHGWRETEPRPSHGERAPAHAFAPKGEPALSLGSARAASDAAAAASHAWPTRRDAHPSPLVLSRRAIVDLLSFEPSLPKRLRRDPRYAEILGALAKTRRVLPAGAVAVDADETDRLDVTRVLSLIDPDTPDALRTGMERALADLESFEVPLFTVHGVLTPSFDQLEALRMMSRLAQPFAARERRLAPTLALVEDTLAGNLAPSAKVVQRLASQLEQAMSALGLPAQYVTETVEKSLLEERKYRKRTLYGATRLRCDLELEGATLPLYLPEAVAERLPLLTACSIVALVEVRPREDNTESSPDALLAFAVGRVVKSASAELRSTSAIR